MLALHYCLEIIVLTRWVQRSAEKPFSIVSTFQLNKTFFKPHQLLSADLHKALECAEQPSAGFD